MSAILLGGCADYSDQLMPGQWEVTTRVETLAGRNANSAGMLSPPPPLRTRHCLTAEETRRPNPGFLTGNGAKASCAYAGLEMKSGRIAAMVECTDSGAIMRSIISGQYQPTNFDAKMNATVAQGELNLLVGSRVSGRRTGEC